ncbi:MAG: glycoside hydrolase family 65 protein [Ktedonobacteraceae bacterium]
MNLWQINEDSFNPQTMHSQETVFTIGNGYFGTRGTFEVGYPNAMPATILFGVFDELDIGKEELANAPDWLLIKLFVNGERFRMDKGRVLDYHRSLDMYTGILTRHVLWESPSGIRLSITSERFASLTEEHVGAIRYTVKAEEDGQQDLDILLRAALHTAVANRDIMHWESLEGGHDTNNVWLLSETRHSDVQLAQTMGFTTQTPGFVQKMWPSDIAPSIHLAGKLAPGACVTAEKIVVMYTTRDTDNPVQAAIKCHKELCEASQVEIHNPSPDVITQAPSTFDALLVNHKAAWQDYWQTSDIIIEGDDKAQLAMRYNIYQLRISASRHDSRYSIAAKGLTGFGYLGHVFHDTEIFMLPYFTYVHPSIARNLLLYRYHLLPGARKKARMSGFEGAQYPWESTLDGDEATPEAIIHPESKEIIPVLNGSIELHITSSIAYAVWRYWKITADDEFMQQYGAEMLLSIATFWASRAEKHPEHDDYEINNVIGPDEWHEHVDNNAFTNYMAKWSIQRAIDALQWLQATAPDKAGQLTRELDLNATRLDHWHDVVARMCILQDEKTDIFEQFDGFFELKPLDQSQFKGRKTSYQGLLGMQTVQKLRIIKQADVLMLLTLLRDDFDIETKRANWDYYYPITDHDYGSSLTPALHAILACELGFVDTAYKLFMKGALVDLENLRGNTPEGIHAASAGAVWQAAILGFAGLHLHDEDGYSTSPRWPDGWTRLAFTCQHKGQLLKIDLRR